MTDFRPLVLTARPDAATHARFEALRRANYPPTLNRVPAHISLFHQLPGSEIDAVIARLKRTAREHRRPPVAVAGLRSLGGGVAFTLHAPALAALHADLAEAWAPLLIPQDRARFVAHVTLQNKVTPAVARATLTQLATGFVPWTFPVVAIDVWRYLDGRWEAVRSVALPAA